VILIDTSVWIDFIRKGPSALKKVLLGNQVVMHPFVIGELALGSLANRTERLEEFLDMPRALVAEEHEVLAAIDRWTLFGKGIGYVDAHVLCSVSLMPGCRLWTRDKGLHAVAVKLGLEMTTN
jgi:predicted nucleic acid-binding protein